MDVERQQGGPYQRLLFERSAESPRHDASSKGGTQAAADAEPQASTALDQTRALTEKLMEEVTHRTNLNRAYRRVKANKGAPGVDGMTIGELADWSAVAFVEERKFLGYRLLRGGLLSIAPKSLDRVKDRIRELTQRNRGTSLERVVGELNSFLSGWVTYFHLARANGVLTDLDQWIRRKLCCLRLKQCKRRYAIARFLMRQGLPAWRAWPLSWSGKGWWRLAGSPQATEAMSNAWFQELGLVALLPKYLALQPQ